MKDWIRFTTTVWSLVVCVVVSLADESGNQQAKEIYPLTISLDIFPDKINYGDICFIRFFVTNPQAEPVYFMSGDGFLCGTVNKLYYEKELLQIFSKSIFDEYAGICSIEYQGINRTNMSNQQLRSNETMMFHLKPIWLPIPEMFQPAFVQQYKSLQQSIDGLASLDRFKMIVQQNKNNFNLEFLFSGIDMPCYIGSENRRIAHKFSSDKPNHLYTRQQEIFTKEDLKTKGYNLSTDFSANVSFRHNTTHAFYEVHGDICVLPRLQSTVDLIHQWYIEIPGTITQLEWTGHGLFVHPVYAKDSHNLDSNKYEKFFNSMRTRTPELLQRINRTKELEAELLKLPDSELSRNMKEFIKLRGYLVDIRFAENDKEEKKAFNNFVTFIDKSKDKKLWIRFVDEIAFGSIADDKYFSYKKVENYRKRFAEKFTKTATLEGQK
jgi:ribosomal protein S8